MARAPCPVSTRHERRATSDGKMEAKISEIFLSYQGEGTFTGSRQLFVRFYGCNLDCVYCDTFLESYKSFSKESLLGKILDFGDDYNELALTGGEPLMYADFLADFLPLYRKLSKRGIYLETNGTLPGELGKVAGYVDIIAMDFKLPSSTGNAEDLWGRHEEFLKKAVATGKEVIVKAVITDSSNIDDIKRVARITKGVSGKFVIVLQEVTPVNELSKRPDEEMLSYFKEYLLKESGKEVRIMGQTHKCLGIK